MVRPRTTVQSTVLSAQIPMLALYPGTRQVHIESTRARHFFSTRLVDVGASADDVEAFENTKGMHVGNERTRTKYDERENVRHAKGECGRDVFSFRSISGN